MDTSGLFAGLSGSAWLVAGIFVGAMLLVCLSAFSPRMDPQEPPSIWPGIPFIGHIVGIFRYQVHYFDMLNAKYGLPIYTLPMLTGKTYVVTSPDLVQSVLRVKNDGLSVEPFLANVVGKNLNDLGPEAMEVWSHISKDKNEPYLLKDMAKVFVKQLTIGSPLHNLSLAALDKFSSLVDSIRAPREENLYLFLRNTFTISAATGLYGPANPMAQDPTLSDAQWTMEAKSLWVFIGLFNKFLFPKAFAARAAVQSAYGAYHSANGDSETGVSAIIRSYVDILRHYGFSSNDIGKSDISIIHGATANAALAFYWLVVHIFADPALLSDLRAEVQAVATEQPAKRSAGGRREILIDISRVATTCPLLYAVHQEILRLQTFSLVTRFVLEDTTISDAHGTQYLLKSGALLQIPSAIPQASPEVWGPDARVFDARRFLKTGSGVEGGKGNEKLQKKAYFPFSGGIHKCPGRHYATTGHLGMVAILVLGFEITTLDGKAIKIPQNSEAQRGLSSGVGKPSDEFAKLQVKVERRKGWQDVIWGFKVAEEK
jgi:hypothetical protein